MAETNAPTLRTLRGPVNEQEALATDRDIIQALSYPQSRFDFYLSLRSRRHEIAALVSKHLGIPQAACTLSEPIEWRHGSFNTCLPVWIHHPQAPRRVIVRFPLPYRVGESHFPGNVEEKVRTEAATYIWLQSKCPSVPIPRFFAFGLPGTQCFTQLETASYWSAAIWRLRSLGAWFSHRDLSPYVTWQRQSLRDVGYLIIEYVEEGRMLSESWEESRHEGDRRTNLFHGLSPIHSELLKHPLPCIGSLTINDCGMMELTNRPLTLRLHELENQGIPTNIARDQVYNSVERYYLDLFACQDNRMRQQPNSIRDTTDGLGQLAALVSMRALLDKFTVRKHSGGPYFLSLTDLHQSNIIVDDEWNIKRIIDLEWACVCPPEMENVPFWLTSTGLDNLDVEAYQPVFDVFVRASREVEERSCVSGERLSRILQSNWDSGRFWFTQALDCPEALYLGFVCQIRPRFGSLIDFTEGFDATLAKLWDQGASDFVTTKVNEHAEYQARIRKLFADIDRSGPPADVTDAQDNESS